MPDPVDILNVYGPYRNRERGLLNSPNLILGGDLNLTLRASETWGTKAAIDPLSSHFNLFFESLGLVDIATPTVGPTWRNGRVGSDGISKKIDRFLIASSLIPLLQYHRVWTQTLDISDHYPICLEWNKKIGSYDYPFKFNRSWINDPDFSSWVSLRWSALYPSPSNDDCELLTHKLRTLKQDVKVWIKEKGVVLDSESLRLDTDICSILSSFVYGILSQAD